MPLFYTQTIDDNTRLAIWEIAEPEAFFLEAVPLNRAIAHPHKRLQHLAGRYLLQMLFPDLPISLIRIADTRKPYLPEESHHFSISHCGPYAAAIVSTTRRVGIDVEQPASRLLRLVPKFLTDAERNLVKPHDTHLLVHSITMLWSAKEAMFKWYSLGEIDFRKHLRIKSINFIEEDAGSLSASFEKFEPQPLQLSFRWWEQLVLSWVVV